MHFFSKLHNYFLVYFTIALSGILLTMRNNTFLILFFLYIMFLSVSKKLSKNNIQKFIIVISVAVIINILQFMHFGVWLINSLLSLIIVFSIGFFINELLKDRYIPLFIKITYFFALVSLFCYSLGLISPASFLLFGNLTDALNIDPHYTNNLLFFNFYDAQTTLFGVNILRNSGFLYEPGMFACILIPALAFNTIIRGSLSNKYNAVFIVTIITTFSTAAYLALAAFLVLYGTTFKGFSLKRSIVVMIVVLVGAGAFWQLDFIGGKIEGQYERAIYGPYSQRYTGRIGSALVDLNEIKNHPLIGRGRHAETRFDQDELFYNPRFRHRVNGIFDLMAAMGIPFFVLYIYILYQRINKFSFTQGASRYAWLIFLVPFLIMASSQTILLRPFFLSFLFLYPFKQSTSK